MKFFDIMGRVFCLRGQRAKVRACMRHCDGRDNHEKFAQSVSYGWPGTAGPALEWAGNGEGTVGYRKKPVEML